MEKNIHLKPQQRPTHSRSHFNLYLNNIVQILRLQKMQIKQLLRVVLFFYFYAAFHNNPIMHLSSRSSKFFCRLKHFELRDISSSDFPIQKVLLASQSLRTAQSLTHFTLKSGHLNHIVGLVHFFKRLKNLERLSLHFVEFRNFRFVNQLFSSLKGLIRLHHLKVVIQAGESISTDTIAELGAGLSGLKALKTLCLDLSGLHFESERGFFRDFKATKSLLSLTLKMRGARGVFDKFLINIGQSLKQMTKLEDFDVNLENCFRITNQGVEDLSLYLPQNLKSLKMDFGSCRQVEEKTMQRLFSSIGRMTFLEHLSLWFSCRNQIRNQEWLDLNMCLSGLKRLRSLLISFQDCHFTIDELIFEEFVWILASKTALRKLTLGYPGCEKMLDNRRLEKLGDLLENLKNLEIFELNLSEATIDDKGIGYFSNRIEALEKVQSLHLNFSYCSLRKIVVLERLIKNLEKLGHLRQAILNFEHCNGIDVEEIKKVVKRTELMKFKLSVLYGHEMGLLSI